MCYSYSSWKYSLLLSKSFIFPVICLLFSSKMLAILLLGCPFWALIALIWQCLLDFLLPCVPLLLSYLPLWLLGIFCIIFCLTAFYFVSLMSELTYVSLPYFCMLIYLKWVSSHLLFCLVREFLFYIVKSAYVRLLAFYFWLHVMSLILKGDNTTDSCFLCCLLHVFSIIINLVLYVKVWIYIQLFYVQMLRQYICVHIWYWPLLVCYIIGYMCIISVYVYAK